MMHRQFTPSGSDDEREHSREQHQQHQQQQQHSPVRSPVRGGSGSHPRVRTDQQQPPTFERVNSDTAWGGGDGGSGAHRIGSDFYFDAEMSNSASRVRSRPNSATNSPTVSPHHRGADNKQQFYSQQEQRQRQGRADYEEEVDGEEAIEMDNQERYREERRRRFAEHEQQARAARAANRRAAGGDDDDDDDDDDDENGNAVTAISDGSGGFVAEKLAKMALKEARRRQRSRQEREQRQRARREEQQHRARRHGHGQPPPNDDEVGVCDSDGCCCTCDVGDCCECHLCDGCWTEQKPVECVNCFLLLYVAIVLACCITAIVAPVVVLTGDGDNAVSHTLWSLPGSIAASVPSCGTGGDISGSGPDLVYATRAFVIINTMLAGVGFLCAFLGAIGRFPELAHHIESRVMDILHLCCAILFFSSIISFGLGFGLFASPVFRCGGGGGNSVGEVALMDLPGASMGASTICLIVTFAVCFVVPVVLVAGCCLAFFCGCIKLNIK